MDSKLLGPSILLLGFGLFLSNKAQAADTGFDPAFAYFTLDGRFKTNEAREALTIAFKAGKPILVYVHGRGKEPNKSLHVKKILPIVLEKHYGVSVIMVNWDSYGFLLDRKRPLRNTPEGASRLGELIMAMREDQQQGKLPNNISLLVHSLGNVVLQDTVEAGAWNGISTPLFKNVVLTSPDADTQGHNVWLEKLASVERVWVTINHADRVLANAGSGRNGTSPLGRGAIPPLAASATYLDLHSAVGSAHQVFNKSYMAGNIALCQFFQSALNSSIGQTSIADWHMESDGLRKPTNLKDPNHPCFDGVGDEIVGDDDQ